MPQEEIETVTEQYDLFRLLNRDEYIPTNVQNILTDDDYYYLKLISGESTIPIYIQVEKDLTIPTKQYMLFAALSDTTSVTPEDIRGTAVDINPNFDRDSDSSDIKSGTVDVEIGGVEHQSDLFTSKPEQSSELTVDEVETLQWKANVSQWYFNNKNDEETAIEINLGEIIDATDGDQSTVTFEIPIGAASTKVTFAVPPDGDNVGYIEDLIEACGGTLENMEKSRVMLDPVNYDGYLEFITDASDGYLKTDCGVFAVYAPGQIEKDGVRSAKQEQQSTPSNKTIYDSDEGVHGSQKEVIDSDDAADMVPEYGDESTSRESSSSTPSIRASKKKEISKRSTLLISHGFVLLSVSTLGQIFIPPEVLSLSVLSGVLTFSKAIAPVLIIGGIIGKMIVKRN